MLILILIFQSSNASLEAAWSMATQDRAPDESLPRHGAEGDRWGRRHGLCGPAVDGRGWSVKDFNQGISILASGRLLRIT